MTQSSIPVTGGMMRPGAASRLAAVTAFALVVIGMTAPAAQADPSTPVAVTVTGGPGTVTVPGTGAVYARRTQTITLGATTDPITQCVDVTSAANVVIATQTAPAGASSWTIPLTAPSGNGVQALTVRAWTSINTAGNCNQSGGIANAPASASYILDNTGPVVVGALDPLPNGQGWLHTDATLTWNATDAGVGLPPGFTPPQVAVNTETGSSGATKATSIADQLGNFGNGSILVKLDKTNPQITGDQSPPANANGWNNSNVNVTFACTDTVDGITRSGIQSCTPPSTVTTEGLNPPVLGTATDNAGNLGSTTVGTPVETPDGKKVGINIDKTAPTLSSGAPTTAANAAGWYNGDVVMHWTASDELSGLAAT